MSTDDDAVLNSLPGVPRIDSKGHPVCDTRCVFRCQACCDSCSRKQCLPTRRPMLVAGQQASVESHSLAWLPPRERGCSPLVYTAPYLLSRGARLATSLSIPCSSLQGQSFLSMQISCPKECGRRRQDDLHRFQQLSDIGCNLVLYKPPLVAPLRFPDETSIIKPS